MSKQDPRHGLLIENILDHRSIQFILATIVICLGIIAIASIVEIGTIIWAGAQAKTSVMNHEIRDRETEKARITLMRILQRVCINTSKTDSDRDNCI